MSLQKEKQYKGKENQINPKNDRIEKDTIVKKKYVKATDDDYNDLVIKLRKYYPLNYDISKINFLEGLLLYNLKNKESEVCLIMRLDKWIEVSLFLISNKNLEAINEDDLNSGITVILYNDEDVNALFALLE